MKMDVGQTDRLMDITKRKDTPSVIVIAIINIPDRDSEKQPAWCCLSDAVAQCARNAKYD